MNIGIIGPPQSGKTTVFHLLTNTTPDPVASHKRESLHGVTGVPDKRVDKLSEMSKSPKTIYVTVEYVDTPGMEEGASKQSWFEGAIKGELKNADALLLVVSAFESDSDPLKDILRIQDELVFADLVVMENRLDKLKKQHRTKVPTPLEKQELDFLEQGKQLLDDGKPLRLIELDANQEKIIRGYQFLSMKPLLAVVNAADDKMNTIAVELEKLAPALAAQKIQAVALSAPLELEISQLEDEEQSAFMTDLGLTELARDRVLAASFYLLGLQSFLTTGDKESRAWPIVKGSSAVEAAGVIHSDLAHGFIRAEVVHYDDFVRENGYVGCRAKGLVRLEGKDYTVKDGDILVIRHSG